MKHPFFTPSDAFVRRTREVFLSAYRTQHAARIPSRSYAVRYFMRGAAAGAAFILVISGVSVYADQTNVGTDSVLYPLKRSNEAVRVALSSADNLPVVHASLAERRLAEIQEVKLANPSSERVGRLARDLEDEVSRSLGALPEADEDENSVSLSMENAPTPQALLVSTASVDQAPSVAQKAMPVVISSASVPALKNIQEQKQERNDHEEEFCTSMKAVLGAPIPEAQQAFAKHVKLVRRFEKKCGPLPADVRGAALPTITPIIQNDRRSTSTKESEKKEDVKQEDRREDRQQDRREDH